MEQYEARVFGNGLASYSRHEKKILQQKGMEVGLELYTHMPLCKCSRIGAKKEREPVVGWAGECSFESESVGYWLVDRISFGYLVVFTVEDCLDTSSKRIPLTP